MKKTVSILLRFYLITISFTTVTLKSNFLTLPMATLILLLLFSTMDIVDQSELLKKQYLSRGDIYIYIFSIIVVLSGLRPSSNNTYIIIYLFSIFIQYFMVKILISNFKTVTIFKYITLGVFITSVFVILEFVLNNFIGINIRRVFNLAYSVRESTYMDKYIRSYGISTEPNYLGLYLVSSLPLVLHYKNTKENKLKDNLLVLLVLSCSLIFTFSALVLVVLVVYVAIFVINKIRQVLMDKISLHYVFLLILLSLFILFFILKIETDSFFDPIFVKINQLFNFSNPQGRLKNWVVNWNLFKKSPIIGHGIGYSSKIYGFSAVNFYLNILVDFGLVGFIPMALFLRNKYKLAKKSRNPYIYLAYVSVLIYFINSSVFYEPIIWLVIGIIDLYIRNEDKRFVLDNNIVNV